MHQAAYVIPVVSDSKLLFDCSGEAAGGPSVGWKTTGHCAFGIH
jgi:hypothetical protein